MILSSVAGATDPPWMMVAGREDGLYALELKALEFFLLFFSFL